MGRYDFWAAAVTVAAALLTSCSSPAEPSGDDLSVPVVAFTTDATSYLAHRLPGVLTRYQFRVISRYENQGTSTVYLDRCFPNSPHPLFSVLSTADVESSYSQISACVGHNQQLAVRGGETRVDTLLVTGPNIFATGRPPGVTEGDFRMYFQVRVGPGDDAPAAPDGSGISNSFRVHITDTVAP